MRITKILWIAVPLVFIFAAALTLLGPGPARKPEMRLRQIVVTADKSDSADIEQALEKIEDIHERLKGGADFGQLALTESEAPNANIAGDMGWMGKGILPRDLEDATFGLERGQFTEIIEKNLGPDRISYRILYVEERRNF